MLHSCIRGAYIYYCCFNLCLIKFNILQSFVIHFWLNIHSQQYFGFLTSFKILLNDYKLIIIAYSKCLQ